jgi:hypothetical protein
VVERLINIEMIFFIAMKGGSWTVRVGWSMTVVRIQYFSFGLRGEAT